MRMINRFLSIIMAYLVFLSVFTFFNRGYNDVQWNPGYSVWEDNRDSFVYYYFDVDTSIFPQEDRVSYANVLYNFFKENDYDGYVAVYDSESENQTEKSHADLYIYMDIEDALSHIEYDKDINDLDFKSDQEKRYLSNDRSDNAYSHVVKLDNRYGEKGFYDGIISKIRHYAMSQIVTRTSSKDAKWYRVYIVGDINDELEIKENMSSVLISPFLGENTGNLLTDYQISMFSGLDRAEDYIRGGHIKSLTKFPTTLILVGATSQFVALLYYSFASSKEIGVRRLYGNSSRRILLKVFAPIFLETVGIFVLTSMILSLSKTGIPGKAGWWFIDILFKEFVSLYVLFAIMSFVIFIVLFQTSSITKSLKHAINPYFTYILAQIMKLLTIIITITPLLVSMTQLADSTDTINSLEKNSIYREGYVVESINFIIRPNHDFREDYLNLVQLVEKHDLNFVTTAVLMSHDPVDGFDPNSPYYPYLTTNETFINKFEIYEKDGSRFKTSKYKKGAILIPVEKEEQFEVSYSVEYIKTLLDVEVVYVENTISINHPLLPNNKATNPIIFVQKEFNLNNTPDINYASIFTTSYSEEDNIKFTEFEKEVTNTLGAIKVSDKHDVYQFTKYYHQYILQQLIPNIFVSVMMLIISTFLTSILFHAIYKKELSIRYLSGNSRLKRYIDLYIIELTILLITSIYLIFDNYIFHFFLIFKSPLSYILVAIVLIIVVGLIVNTIIIKRTESDMVQNTLKGGD